MKTARERGYSDGLDDVYRNPYSKYYESAEYAAYESGWDRGQEEAGIAADWG